MKPLYRAGLDRYRQDDRDRRLVRVADDPERPGDLRPGTTGCPPAVVEDHPARGARPPFDPTNSDMVGWAEETSLDVEYSHAMAPGANILLVETPVAETEGVTGFPQIVRAENFVINHNLGDVITQSFGATEQTFPSAQSILSSAQRVPERAVARRHGAWRPPATPARPTTRRTARTTTRSRVTRWPSSDPLVTSVGGTQLHLDASRVTGPRRTTSGTTPSTQMWWARPRRRPRAAAVVDGVRPALLPERSRRQSSALPVARRT